MGQNLPRVLVLTAGDATTGIRITPNLEVLRLIGRIAGYCVVDRDLNPLGPDRFDQFTGIIVQRNPGRHAFRWLQASGKPFVYDIDDLLTDLPARAGKDEEANRARIAWCLENATVVTTSGGRLPDILQQRSGVDFADRHVALPNGLWPPRVDEKRWSQPARTLLWVSSDLPLIEQELPDLAGRLAEQARRLGLQLLLLGRFPDESAGRFTGARHIESLSFASYRHLLSLLPAPIAVAPLPVALGAHQPFVDSKSDIKVVDFQGHGIPALYSNAAPYAQSDLAPAGLLPNDVDVWADRLAELAARPETAIDRAAVDRVHENRSFARLCATLDEALQAATCSVAMPRGAISPKFRKAEQALRAWRKRVTGKRSG